MRNKILFLLFMLTFLFLFPPGAMAQEAYATPKSGEGISTFLIRNNRPGRANYKKFIELNKKQLRGKEELRLGVKYLLPPVNKKEAAKRKSDKQKKAEIPSRKTAQATKPKAIDTVFTNGPNGIVPVEVAANEEAPTNEEPAVSAEALVAADVVTEELSAATESEAKEKEKETSTRASSRRKVKNSIYEPLFGSALEKVKVTSSRLKGACFYVVSGHGGPDPGAIGKIGRVELHEDEYAYDVALRLARNLMQEGAEVHIIIQDAKDGIRNEAYLANSKRETCMGDAIPLNQVARLQQRCAKINSLYRRDRKNYKYCRAIFLHVDSRSKSHQTDVYFYHAPNSVNGKRIAITMKNTFESKYGKHQPNRGFRGTVSPRNLYVLANASPASAFVELGNIQNSFDQRRFVNSSNRQALAKWMMEGFIADFKKGKN